ncbi:MAG: hypothetical protein AB7R89_07585 [Dehalococcoidia bacterium]
MAVDVQPRTSQTTTRPGVVQALRIVSPLIVIVILIQAVFAGRGLFLDTDNLSVHGGIGMLTLLLAVVQAVLVPLTGIRGGLRTGLIAASVVLVGLVVVQLGLGEAGKDGGQAAALHVPNGVLIFGIASGIAAKATGLRPGGSTQS